VNRCDESSTFKMASRVPEAAAPLVIKRGAVSRTEPALTVAVRKRPSKEAGSQSANVRPHQLLRSQRLHRAVVPPEEAGNRHNGRDCGQK
jgi:hypothetical protein